MRKVLPYIILSAAFTLLLGGCMPEKLETRFDEDGIVLYFSTGSNVPITKAYNLSGTAYNENKINSVDLFFYREGQGATSSDAVYSVTGRSVTQVDDNTYWSGDPDRHYNEMVDIRDVPDLVMDDSEHIVDYEYQYQYCLNISFNEDGTPGRGSAIFLHCFGPAKPYTGGCVAVPENIMRMIMQQVSPDCVVIIDTFENLGGSF